MRRIAILAEGLFGWHYGKTATGVIRYSQDTTVAVIDSTQAGQDVAHALQRPIGEGIPIVQDITEALTYQPDTLLIGIAPRGGALPASWRWQILNAIEHGLNIVSGLHVFLGDDEELRAAAQKHNVSIWDVRRAPEKTRVAEFVPHREGSHTILLVGSDCSSGKMSTALDLNVEAQRRGHRSAFVATGQTGMMIANNGLPVDSLINDFAAGLMEEQVLQFTNSNDWVFVEGQGALNHPGYSPVTLSLLHGSVPDALIFCHKAGQTTIEGYPQCPLPTLNRLIEINEEAVSWLKPERKCRVVGISLITNHLDEQAAREAITQVEQETGLPVTDGFRFGIGPLLDALENHFK
ncbi:DUF1611 domain-containing protein [Dictyobacter arantiisoli]|uniref:EBNA-1 nuclear protein n=1 Tax=Dictyobacter arantiisoli TaxID=2014874 RepID=A0A5A5TJB2_9CHLR|nr:DUF1611 domain-containing protein [Dictyobacter arantiisoli]GCF11700.1 hypothetical protein KDI_52640 [Dictyobacter arantiisoli]